MHRTPRLAALAGLGAMLGASGCGGPPDRGACLETMTVRVGAGFRTLCARWEHPGEPANAAANASDG